MRESRFTYYECDRCAIKLKKNDTFKQKGLRVCPKCFDDETKYKEPNLRWGSPRANSTTTTAVETSTVFSITAAGGITPSHSIDSELTQRGTLGYSNLPDRILFGAHYYMQVKGDGSAIDITANPQIAAGTEGDILTLEGTDSTNTVLLEDGTGLSMPSSFTLKDDSTITFVYSGSVWVETSRKEL